MPQQAHALFRRFNTFLFELCPPLPQIFELVQCRQTLLRTPFRSRQLLDEPFQLPRPLSQFADAAQNLLFSFSEHGPPTCTIVLFFRLI